MTAREREPFEYYSSWREDALCATPENAAKYFVETDVWFPEDDAEDQERDRNDVKALSICFDCPVRDLCLRDALETQTTDGTRGGNTQEMIRVALSVDDTGKEVRRGDYPDCPYCGESTDSLTPITIDLPEGGRWSVAKAVRCDCGFEWKSRSSYNAVTAYFADKLKRAEAERKEQIARERLSN